MTQLSNTVSTCKAQWKMWLFKVFGVIYLTAVCAAEDAMDATLIPTDKPLTTAWPKVITTAYVPPVPILQQRSPWSDVFPSEKVEFSCTIDGSFDWNFIWYRNGAKIDPDQNLFFLGDGKMVLSSTAATDSGSYSCEGQHKTKNVMTQRSNLLELKVSANKPKPKLSQSLKYQEMFPGESITFTCMVDVSNGWEYLWYHNGQKIQAANDSTYKIAYIDRPYSGDYHCKAKRGQFNTEASETTTLRVSDPPTPTLNLRSRWLDVFEGETVELNCEVRSSDWMSIWYINQTKVQDGGDLIVDEDMSTLNITSVTETYQGDYECKAYHTSRGIFSGFSNTVKVNVYDDLPTPTLSKDGFNRMYVGETVNFTCKVTVSSGWTYKWYKDENPLVGTSETISIYLGPSDNGSYSCMATRGEIETYSSVKKQQYVIEIPRASLKLSTSWWDVFPTESVKLRCGMQAGSGWTYMWYKDNVEVQADDTVSFDSDRATLSINSASSGKHTGQYKCKGHLQDRTVISNSSPLIRLKVYDEKPAVTLTQDPEYKVMFPGEFVSFSCHINVSSGWEYLWYKDDSPLGASGNSYSISSVKATSKGPYTCRAKRGTEHTFTTDSSQVMHLEVEKETPKPSMTQQPAAEKLYTGESVSFECKVEGSSGWNYYWFKDGAPLLNKSSSFQIVDASSLDSGNYECEARRDRTMYNTQRSDGQSLSISEIPVPFLKPVTKRLDVFPGEGVELSCGMPTSSDWTYTWYKDTKEVQADAVSFGNDRTTLTIRSASAMHSGNYSCSGKLKSRSVNSKSSSELTLDVYDTKPRVTLLQNPEYSLMHTGDSVSFSCHINVSSGWKFLWYKDDNPLDISANNHTIGSVVTGSTGSYKCRAKRGTKMVFNTDLSQARKLDIKERPQAGIILLTGWSEVFSTDSLVLQCKVMDSPHKDWNYTWFREGQQINTSLSERYSVTPHNDPVQSLYTCQGIRTGRPSYSKSSDSFKTKNLLLKRRVLLSISGCLFFGIIAVLLGCIILRFTRKPADDDDKPEEANLFLTMAQLKDCADAPCPLVEYITDADLNAPPKEGDENDTVCSETTPLPITSPEDKAVTSDNHDTTENGGGLVSFQQ